MPLDHSSVDTSAKPLPLKGEVKLATLGQPQRVWAVGSIYGRCGSLSALHEILAGKIRPKDRLIYLGNYLGPHSLWTGEGPAAIDELIAFRAALISQPGFFASDVVFLHGQGEDLFQQALRLTFRKNHAHWIDGALAYGLECYTLPYGADAGDLTGIGSKGIIAINRFTHRLQENLRKHAGHGEFFAHLKSAAFTAYPPPYTDLAFVPAGFNPAYTPALQNEYFCWPQEDIIKLKGWKNFRRVLRGQAPRPEAPQRDGFVVTLDDGLGLEGKLHAACLDPHGRILEWFST